MDFFLKDKVYRLLVAQYFDGVSSGMFMMALPWMMLTGGDDGSGVAIVALICTLTSFFLTPLFSTLIDRHSRKGILVLMQLVQAFTALGLFASAFYGEPGIVSLGIAQIIFWVSNDVAWHTSSALTQENFSPDEYPRISSYQEVIMQVVTLGAGAAGVVVLELWDIQRFALFAFVASSLAFVLYGWMPYRRQLQRNVSASFVEQLVGVRDIFARDRGFFLFLALSCLSYPVVTYLVKLVPVYLANNNYEGHWFALWKSGYGVGAMVCGLFVVGLLMKFRHEKLMIFSVLMIAGLLGVMALRTDPLVIVCVAVVLGFFTALNRIARTNKMNLVIDLNERGRVDGGLALFTTLSQSLSYVLIAVLAHYEMTEQGFAIVALVMGAAGLGMYVYDNQHVNEQKQLTCN